MANLAPVLQNQDGRERAPTDPSRALGATPLRGIVVRILAEDSPMLAPEREKYSRSDRLSRQGWLCGERLLPDASTSGPVCGVLGVTILHCVCGMMGKLRRPW